MSENSHHPHSHEGHSPGKEEDINQRIIPLNVH